MAERCIGRSPMICVARSTGDCGRGPQLPTQIPADGRVQRLAQLPSVCHQAAYYAPDGLSLAPARAPSWSRRSISSSPR